MASNRHRAAGLKTIITINDYTYDHDFSKGLFWSWISFGEPDQPSTTLQGQLNGKNWLDIEQIKKLAALTNCQLLLKS